MRAAPAFQVSLNRDASWRVAIALLVAAELAVVFAWGLTRPVPWGAWGWAAAIAMSPGVLALGASLVRTPPGPIGWNGRAWFLGSPAGEPQAGDLLVEIDLGNWMLLRFVPDGGGSWGRGRHWLPARRRGNEAAWHALRCALYSPRVASAGPA